MQGFNAVEIVADFDSNAYRGVYTTKFKESIYVLHCFQKKSTIGVKTPKRDLDLVEKRLKAAEEHHKQLEREKKEKERAATDKGGRGKR